MPIQENSEGLPFEKETRKGSQSTTSASEALAIVKTNTTAISEPTQNEMTKGEALAIAWTGIEALALMGQANLYRSPKTGRVVIELLATEWQPSMGLVSVGTKCQPNLK